MYVYLFHSTDKVWEYNDFLMISRLAAFMHMYHLTCVISFRLHWPEIHMILAHTSHLWLIPTMTFFSFLKERKASCRIDYCSICLTRYVKLNMVYMWWDFYLSYWAVDLSYWAVYLSYWAVYLSCCCTYIALFMLVKFLLD